MALDILTCCAIRLCFGLCFRYFQERKMYNWEFESFNALGDEMSDGFSAVREAAKFPFRPTAHKMVVLIVTKEQVSGIEYLFSEV